MSMIVIDIVPAGGGNVQAVVKGQVRATGATAAIVIAEVAKVCGSGATIYAPKAMAHCMKAGDIVSRGDINSAAAPAFTSTRR